MVHNLVKDVVLRGQIQTTYARAKEAQRLTDRLVSLGKEGSIHARRRAFRVLQDRSLVKRLFTDIAPVFGDVAGGYTRIVRVSLRRGDGAQQALLAFSRSAAGRPVLPGTTPAQKPQAPSEPGRPQPQKTGEEEKPKGFFEGLRTLWMRKKKGRAVSSGSAR